MRAPPRAAPPRPAAAAARRPPPRRPAGPARSPSRTATRRRRARPTQARTLQPPASRAAWAATGAVQPPPRRATAARSARQRGAGVGVVQRRRDALLAAARLQHHDALADLRHEAVDGQAEADLAPPAPGAPARRPPAARASSPRSAALAQAGVDVAAHGLDDEVRAQREQLGAAPHRGRPDPRPRRHVPERPRRTAPGVARVGPRQAGGQRQLRMVVAGQVLGGVHRDVDPPLQQRLLDLPHEHAAAAELREPAAPVAIAERRDRHDGDRAAERAQPVRRRARPGPAPAASRACRARWTSGSLTGQIEELVHRGGEVAPLAVDRAVASGGRSARAAACHDGARQPLDELAIALAERLPAALVAQAAPTSGWPPRGRAAR